MTTDSFGCLSLPACRRSDQSLNLTCLFKNSRYALRSITRHARQQATLEETAADHAWSRWRKCLHVKNGPCVSNGTTCQGGCAIEGALVRCAPAPERSDECRST